MSKVKNPPEKWHINIHGIPAQCTASVQECRRQQGSRDGIHYDTYEEAYAASQQEMRETYGETAAVTKKAPVTPQKPATHRDAAFRAQLAEKLSVGAHSAAGELAIKRQHFEHDDEMIVEQLNDKLPPSTVMAGRYSSAATFDQVHPHTVTYVDQETGQQTRFHYTQAGTLGLVTGDGRNSEASRGVEKMLQGDPKIQHDIKKLAATRLNADIATRREIDMQQTRHELEQISRGESAGGALGMRHVSSLDRLQDVPPEQQNKLVQDMNAASDVKVREVVSPYGGPSQFILPTDHDKGIDVTNIVLNSSHRYTNALRAEHAELHRNLAVLKMEQLHDQHAVSDRLTA